MEVEVDSSDTRMPPTGIQYKLQPMGLEATSNHREFYPENGATQYGPSGSGKSNIIRIPLNVQGLVDGRHSYLKFTLTNNSGQTFDIYPSVNNIVRRVRILSSSNVELERLDNYNNLHATLSDLLMPRDYRVTVGNACEGFEDTQQLDATAGLEGTVSGYSTITNGSSRGFAVPLISGFLNSKYIPSFAVGGSGVVIEIELENTQTAFYVQAAPAAAGYTVSNVRFICDVIDMSPDFYQSFKEALKMRPIQWGNTCYYGTTSTVAAGSTINAILGLKFRSINAILTTVRAIGSLNANQVFGMMRLALNGASSTAASYQYRIGSKLYPQAPITVSSEDCSQAMAESYKAFTALGNTAVSGSVRFDNFGTNLALNKARPGPIYAIDLANYSQDVSIRESGLDTSSNGLMVEFVATSVNAAAPNDTAKQLDAYAQYDCVWTLDGMGNLTAQA